MPGANVSPGGVRDLPDSMSVAQAAIQLPEIQAMLERLGEYHLGICMPHMHDEATGEFGVLADDLLQVEAGLEVSFHIRDAIAAQAERFLPVGWAWRRGASATVAVCEMEWKQAEGDSRASVKHKMPATR